MKFLILFILFIGLGLLLGEIFVVLQFTYYFFGFVVFGTLVYQKIDKYFGKGL